MHQLNVAPAPTMSVHVYSFLTTKIASSNGKNWLPSNQISDTLVHIGISMSYTCADTCMADPVLTDIHLKRDLPVYDVHRAFVYGFSRACLYLRVSQSLLLHMSECPDGKSTLEALL